MTSKGRVYSLAAMKAALAEKIVEEGGEFRTCANCGTLYPLEASSSETVCGERCAAAYVAYLNDPSQW
jgi:hypothetical protein